MANDLRNYLKAETFYWYRKVPKDGEYDSYRDCFVFTDNYFTNACYVKPEIPNISQKQKDEIYSKSLIVNTIYGGQFEYKELPQNIIDAIEKQLDNAQKFIQKVNRGEVQKLKRAVMQLGKFAILYKDFQSPIIFINNNEILEPGMNLLENLMGCACLSDNDEIRLYYDEDDEIVYLSWYEEMSKSDYWIMGIKPVAFTDSNILKKGLEELFALSDLKLQEYKSIGDKNAQNNS